MSNLYQILSVLSQAAFPQGSCDRLVLASSVEELTDLDPCQPGLVIFITDWLGWVTWRQRGGQAVHHESFLVDWPTELGPQDSFQQRAVTWMYDGGTDATLFEGVSLGKQFNWEVTGVRLAAGRILSSLSQAFQLLRPREIEYRGLRVEYAFLDDAALFELASLAVERHGLPMIDRRGEVNFFPRLDPELPFNGEFSEPPLSRRLTLRMTELVTDAVSRLFGLLRTQAPRVFILHNLLVVRSLIEHLPVGQAIPVLIAKIHPKRPSFLFDAWRKGVRLMALSDLSLNHESRRRLKEIRGWIAQFSDSASACFEERAVKGYLRRHLLSTSSLEARAVEVLQFKRLFERERPSRILVGDSENHMVRLACEVAQTLGIGVDELPNGMFLTAQRMDSRSGDGFRKPVIDRFLAWGKSGLRWAARSHVAVPAIETGYPVADSLRCIPTPPASGKGRALILPLHVDKTDLTGLYSEVFANLILAVRAARDCGYADIRIKVHPGFINLPYYQEVMRRCGDDALVLKDGSLLPHIAWSDVIIGPVNSGAMIEAAALGRPYVAVLNPPTAIDPELSLPAKSIQPSDLRDALSRGKFEDAPAILADIAGCKSGAPAGERVWSAILSMAA
ncbi:conserved hypothetical protein [Rhodospirillaceae bacterium LM-1]|nr:conserved hypothetical protein [Rhodospirillaceae bacterium LM-1]